MTSNIDITQPAFGSPTTLSVRTNFQAAHDEIGAIQACGLPTPASLGSGALILPSTQVGGNLGPGVINCQKIQINTSGALPPTSTIDLVHLSAALNTPARIFVDTYGTTNNGAALVCRQFPGVPGTWPQPPTTSGMGIGSIGFQGSDGVSTTGGGSGVQIMVYALETWSPTAHGSQLQIVTAIPTQLPNLRVTIDSNLTLNSGTAYNQGGVAWQPIPGSSREVKKNIADLGLGLAELCKLRPVTFQYNGTRGGIDDGRTYHGLIAEEVREAIPEMVGEHVMRFAHENQPTEEYHNIGVDSTPLIYAVLNALKEIDQRLKALEER